MSRMMIREITSWGWKQPSIFREGCYIIVTVHGSQFTVYGLYSIEELIITS